LEAAPGALYVVSVKYETDSVEDTEFNPENAPTYNYTFATYYEGDLSETDDQGGINLSFNEDPDPDALTLDGSATVGGEALTQAALAPVVEAAINYWAEHGIDAEGLETLLNTTIKIDDLGSTLLGQTDGLTVTLDDDAAGYGWSDSLDAADADEVDLLSAVVHEFGHLLDYGHDILDPSLGVGERELPDLSAILADSGAELDSLLANAGLENGQAPDEVPTDVAPGEPAVEVLAELEVLVDEQDLHAALV